MENFPKAGKEIATQVQETQSPKQDKPKVKHPKTHINQIKNKEQILKAAREKQQLTHKGIPIRITAYLSIEQSDEREKPTTQITVPSKDLIQIRRKNQKLCRQANLRVSAPPNQLSQRMQWQPTPICLPLKSHGQRSLVGCSPWGH